MTSPAQVEQRRTNAETIAAERRAATRCKRDHEFTPANTIVHKNGRRECRTCAYDRHWYWRHGLGMIA